MKTLAIALVSASALAQSAHAGVLVVDAAGGAPFSAIQPAIDAASDGDTVLVKPGSYAAFTIDGKALALVGDVGALPAVTGRVRIANVSIGREVVVARLRLTGAPSPAAQRIALQVENSAGSVRIDACTITGGTTGGANAGTGALLSRSTDVAFANCVVAGGNGWFDFSVCSGPGERGGDGLYSDSSVIALYDCDVRGGTGGDTPTNQHAPRGGDALVVAETALEAFCFASRSTVRGGNAGSTSCLLEDPYGGDGGDGIVMASTAQVRLLDDAIQGGAHSCGGPMFGKFLCGSSGAPIVGGAPLFYAVSSLAFSTASVAREGTDVALTFRGDPGDLVYLNDALATTFQLVPSWRGIKLVPFANADHPGAMRVRRWGVIPASGVLTRTYHVAALAPGVEAQTRYLQAYRLGGTGLTLGGFATLTVLDSAF